MRISGLRLPPADTFLSWFSHHFSTRSKATLSHESAVAVLLKGTEKKNNTHIGQMHINLTNAKIVTYTEGQIICLHLLRIDTILIYYIQTKSIPVTV